MSAIVDNIEHLTIQWAYAYYDVGKDKYVRLTDEMLIEMNVYEYHDEHGKWPIADALCVSIKLRDGATKELFDVIGKELIEHKVRHKIIPPKRRGNWVVASEFVEVETRKKEEINEKNIKIKEHVDSLLNLGANTLSVIPLKYKVAHEHRLYSDEIYDLECAEYMALCHKGIWLYDILLSTNILSEKEPLLPDTNSNGCVIS